MSWFNWYGLVLMGLMMVPNIFFAATHQEGFENVVRNPRMEAWEQIGRFGCFICMLITPPALCTGYWLENGVLIYRLGSVGLVGLYVLCWRLLWKKNSVAKSLILSILPSLLFFFCAIMQGHWLMLLLAAIFAFCHIWISYQNAAARNKGKKA